VTRTATISPSPTDTPLPVVIQVGDASGQPGLVVGFDVTIATRGLNVAGAGVCIDYDPATPIRALQGNPDCSLPLGIGKQGEFTFTPSGCDPGTTCSGICADIGGSPSVIMNGATLFNCRIAIAPNAPLEEFPLTCSAPSASDPNGAALVAQCTSGVAIVQINIPGDCNGDGMVTIDELITGVNIALGNLPVTACPAFDTNRDGRVTIEELIAAVNAALNS